MDYGRTAALVFLALSLSLAVVMVRLYSTAWREKLTASPMPMILGMAQVALCIAPTVALLIAGFLPPQIYGPAVVLAFINTFVLAWPMRYRLIRTLTSPDGGAPTLFITRGLPGCGKTTHARALVAGSEKTLARVNRDDLRMMLHNGWHGPDTEKQVTTAAHRAIFGLLQSSTSVVCDDTNLEERHLLGLRRIAWRCGAHTEIIDMRGVPLETCLARNAQRAGKAFVNPEHIVRMHRDHIASTSGCVV